jgi:hypothetical protein
MADPQVWVFFYGSYINLDVLRDLGLVPERYEVARLPGFDIRVAPLANLVRADGQAAYGILATATHADLHKLYDQAQQLLGEVYLPEAVLVETLAGTFRPALCYICPEMTARPADPVYLDRLIHAARLHGFPAWYLQRLESFRVADA